MALQDLDVFVTVPNVDGWLNVLNDYARSAVRSANLVASGLGNLSLNTLEPTVTFEGISSPVSIGSPSKPTVPNIPLVTRQIPTAPTIITPAIVGNSLVVPDFNGVSPTISLPSPPNPLTISAPVKNFVINLDQDFPISPDLILPDVPTFISLNIPTAIPVDLPLFDLDFPTSNNIVVPGLTFSFLENAYSSTLLDKVKSELLARLSGGSGLNPIVEQAIWDRGRDRENRASLLSVNNLLTEEASRGFSRPVGTTYASLEAVIQDTQSKLIELSREVMIKQAELEQENLKTSIQQTIALEDILIREHNNVVQRAFEVAKYMQDIAIELFKVQVSRFTMEVEAYKAFSQAYSARVQAELSKIEIFKAQIEGEKLKGDINEQNVRLYLARIEGVKSNVEIYKTLVSVVSEKLRAEAIKVEAYKVDVDAYSATIRAKADEFGMYSEQIKGELAKTDIFESQVKAFTSRVQAYAAQSDVQNNRAKVEVDIQELNIKKYEASLEAFIKQVQADQQIYQSAVDIYRGEAAIYSANIGLATAQANIDVKNSENIILQNRYRADIGLQNAQITLESIKNAYNAMITARQSAGSIYQSIASSALSSINVSASLGGSVSMSASESHNYSVTQ
jgi:hypothetical protein